jgi:D-alanyl-D-alanine carboxypeptidase
MKEAEIFLKKQVQNAETPSVQYLLFNRNQVIDHIMYGYAQIEKAVRINEHSTYNAFSVTKTFTALAVLQLAEQKIIDPEDSLKKYLPQSPYPAEICIKHVLSHTSGIPNPVPLSWIHLVEEHEVFNSQRFFLTLFSRNKKLSFPPGQRFSYSNLGYVLLGWLIEQVSGLPYEVYIQQNIISKLNISPAELGFRIGDAASHVTGYHEIISFSYLLLGFLLDKNKYFDKRESKWKSFRHYYVNGPSYGGLIGTP